MKQTLNITHPEIYAQWIDMKDGRDPANYTYGSNQVFTWQCNDYENHQWETKIKVRSMGSGCAICANRTVLKGFNDLKTKIPELASQWDYEKNGDLSPSDVSYGSEIKYWWICKNGHSILSNIFGRKSKKTGQYDACPACSGRVAITGSTDLKTLYPDVALQCISDIDTSTITAYSSQKLKWRCSKGHEKIETVKTRVNRKGDSCDVCKKFKKINVISIKESHSRSGEKVKSLTEERKRIAREKSFQKRKPNFLSNKSSTLFSQIVDKEANKEISYNSAKRVEWICEKNHTWSCTVYQRYNRNTGCPVCNAHTYTSKGEKELLNFVKSIYSGEIIENTRSVIRPYELDIYLPDLKIAIEYNGLYWHSDKVGKDKNYHYDKWKMCYDQGVQLFTVWEDDWRDKKEIVKSLITHKIGSDDVKSILDVNCDVVKVSIEEAKEFCNKHHLQGYALGSVHYALIDRTTGSLVSVSVWDASDDVLHLKRYCTSENVIGGMGAMVRSGMTYAREHGLSRIITFSDRNFFNDEMYSDLKFSEVGIVEPVKQ